MRKLIFAINMTIDGCCDHTKVTPHEDIHEYFTDMMQDAGLLLYGRKTYDLMVPFWPDVAKTQSVTKALNKFAIAFDAVDRAVVSRTLENVEDKKTKILSGDLHNEVLKLKQEPGKDIMTGGVDLASQLMALGLVDEYRIVIHPVIVGAGRRLMEGVDLPENLNLKLVESRVLGSGCVALRYVKE